MAPTELEAVLLRHPDIVDVGVIGVAVYIHPIDDILGDIFPNMQTQEPR